MMSGLLVHAVTHRFCSDLCPSLSRRQIGSHIKKQVHELGFSCTGLVTKAGALQCSPNDSFTKKELIESARKVSEKVRYPRRSALFFWGGDPGPGPRQPWGLGSYYQLKPLITVNYFIWFSLSCCSLTTPEEVILDVMRLCLIAR